MGFGSRPMANIRQPRTGSGPGFQVKVPTPFKLFPLRSETEWRTRKWKMAEIVDDSKRESCDSKTIPQRSGSKTKIPKARKNITPKAKTSPQRSVIYMYVHICIDLGDFGAFGRHEADRRTSIRLV